MDSNKSPGIPSYTENLTGSTDMVQALQAAHLENLSHLKMRNYTGPSLLVIDELGYLPLDKMSANWIFQVVSRRYDRGSVILTSNRGFSDWNQGLRRPSGGRRDCGPAAPQRHRTEHPWAQLPDAGPPRTTHPQGRTCRG